MSDLPDRAAVPSPVPVGVRTASVESLTSYVRALATTLMVPVIRLVSDLIVSYGGNGSESRRWSDTNSYRNPMTVNGPTPSAEGWSQCVAEVTGRSEVSNLTLASWSLVLPTRSLIKPTFSYCADCFADSESSGSRPYERLAWTISDVCVDHERVLQQACPHCERAIEGADVLKGAPGRCPFCSSSLSGRPAHCEVASAEQMHVAYVAGRLAASASDGASATQARVTELIETGRSIAGTAKGLAALLGVSSSLVSEWRHANTRPSFLELVRVAQVCNLELISFLLGRPDAVDDQSAALVARRAQAKGMPWPAAEELMADVLRDPDAKPLSYVIAKSGHDRKILNARYPVTTTAIKRRFIDARAKASSERRSAIDLAVTDAVMRLRSQNARPSRRALEAELSGFSVREEGVRTAWLKHRGAP